MGKKDEVRGKKRIEQAKRLEYFPSDRIPFLNTDVAVLADRFTFKHYYENYKSRGFSEVIWAVQEIEKANYLPKGSITPELFMRVAQSLGYDPYKYTGLEEEEDEE